jgi:hypothetical protein
MIVRSTAIGDLLLITQPDHAGAAGVVAERWRADGLPDSPRRDSVLRAVRDHDFGWADADAAPIVDVSNRRVLDFVSAPLEVRQGVWPRSVANLSDNPWAAALVAQHAMTVYDRYRGQRDWDPFFERMTSLRDYMLSRVEHESLESLHADYRFLRLSDLASLAFCNLWDDVQRFAGYEVMFASDVLTIRPDPFDGGEFEISVAARRVPLQAVSSAQQVTDAFSRAPVETLTAVVRGSS